MITVFLVHTELRAIIKIAKAFMVKTKMLLLFYIHLFSFDLYFIAVSDE